VHHRAIAIALYVFLSALMRICPSDFTNLGALTEPLAESMKRCFKQVSISVTDEVDERVPEVHASAEVNWKVDEVIPSPKAIGVKQFHKAV
jgi:hypothetical protein